MSKMKLKDSIGQKPNGRAVVIFSVCSKIHCYLFDLKMGAGRQDEDGSKVTGVLRLNADIYIWVSEIN